MHVGFNSVLLLKRLFNEGDIDQDQADKFLQIQNTTFGFTLYG